jgi:hypothetical protein
LSSLLLSSHFASELRATVFDLFNSWGNIATHVPRKAHSVSTCMSLHVHEPEGNFCSNPLLMQPNPGFSLCTPHFLALELPRRAFYTRSPKFHPGSIWSRK